MDNMAKRIYAMRADEIAAIPKASRDKQFKSAVVFAVGQSIQHSNADAARALIRCLPSVNKKSGARDCLVKYFEDWGNLYYSSAKGAMRYTKRLKPEVWTPEYENQLMALAWDAQLEDVKPKNTLLDADKEIRALVTRLRKFADDPDRMLLHSALLTKVEEVLYAYGRSDAKAEEDKRGRTLFDASTKMSTMRAGKYAR